MFKAKYHRWLAVGLLSILVIVVVIGISFLLSYGLTYHDEKTDLLFRLQHKQKIAARKDVVAQNLETIKKQFSEQGYFINRDTEALASADLQNIIKTSVNDAGGQLTSTQGLPGKVENGFNRITVRVRMTGSIETVRSVLHTFATTGPLLIIDQIDISSVRGPRVRNNNKSTSTSQLNVSFQVVCFMRTTK